MWRIVTVAVGSLALGLMLVVFVRAARDVEWSDLSPAWLVLAVFGSCVAWCLFALGWSELATGPRHHTAVTWVRTQVLRYLPGAVWALAARGRTVGGSWRDRVRVIVVEAGTITSAAFGLGCLFWALGGHPWALPGVLAPFAAYLTVRLLDPGRRSTLAVVGALGWYAAGWLMFALAGLAAQRSVGPVESVPEVLGAVLLAWCVGYVAVLAPGGAGVREVAYAALASGAVITGGALPGAALTRLTNVVGELVAIGLAEASLALVRRRSSTPLGGTEPAP